MKFKVGDNIKIINGVYKGKKGIVIKIASLGCCTILVKFKDGIQWWSEPDNLKLIKPKLTEERIIEIIDKRLDTHYKKLETIDTTGLCDKIKPEKPKSGWYKNKNYSRWLMYYDFENNKVYGFDTLGDWVEIDDIDVYSTEDYLANPKEVEQRLIEEANRRGLKPLNHKCLDDGKIWADNVGGEYDFSNNTCLMIGASVAFREGKWAEIIEDTVTINGYEMKQEGNSIKFGCMSFTSSRVKALYKNCQVLGIASVNVYIDDYDFVTVTTNQLKEIVNNIK